MGSTWMVTGPVSFFWQPSIPKAMISAITNKVILFKVRIFLLFLDNLVSDNFCICVSKDSMIVTSHLLWLVYEKLRQFVDHIKIRSVMQHIGDGSHYSCPHAP